MKGDENAFEFAVPVAIIGYARSPFHFASKGALAGTRPDDLLAGVIRAVVERVGVDKDVIEDVLVGTAFPEGEQGLNVARTVSFLAGLPDTAGAATVNRYCGSSMQAIHMAAGAIQTGATGVFVCCGVESMSRVPMMGFNPMLHPGLSKDFPQAYCSMGITAENVAERYGVSREDQEAFAISSQLKAVAARTAGRLKDEIVTVETKAGEITEDGCPRPDTSAEGLAGLEPAFLKGGTVTAGTASPLTDGAAVCLVAPEAYARAAGLPILARIRAMAVAGCAPEMMGIGPVPASRKALARAGLTMAEMDVIELNEAFAAQVLACMRELEIDPARVNLDGGAIALGHPLGATGARITGKAAALLSRIGGRYALATQCIGGGQGIATVLEAAS